MSTTIAPIAKVEDAIETARDNVAAFGATVWGRAFMHLVHVATFIAFVLHRDDTVMPASRWIVGLFGSFAWGIPASLVHLAAQSFDGIWSLVLGVVL